MGRSLSFFDLNLDSGEIDEHESFTGVSLGSGDCWPCYWRLFLIAAYKQNLADENRSSELKDKISDILLQCCPPSTKSIDNSKVNCGTLRHLMMSSGGFGGGMMGILGMGGSNDMVAISPFLDPVNLSYLEIAGVDAIFQLYLLHNRTGLTSNTIKKVATMMETLKPYLPLTSSDLEDTPYFEQDEYNLADERCIDLADCFIEAAKHDHVVTIMY